MRLYPARAALVVVLGAAVLSCTDSPTAIRQLRPGDVATADVPVPPRLVISQVYGGGGNSGATLKNDFIEIFNPTGQPQSTSGMSVQYASSVGITWQVTQLAALTIPAGGYYLVQEAQGTGGTISLPTPNAIGTIAMSATAGKVALVGGTTALTGACPAATVNVVDFVSFGTTASDCGSKTTATLDNKTAAIRGDDGCKYTGDLSADFAVKAPLPRNSTTPLNHCPGTIPLGPFDHVTISGDKNVIVGSTIQLTAEAQDENGQTLSAESTTWTSGDESIATIDASGSVTGVAASADSVTITATVTVKDVTKQGTFKLAVTNLEIHWIDVSTSSASLPPGFQTQVFVTARAS